MARRVDNNEFARLIKKLRDEDGKPLSNKQIADLTLPFAMTKAKRGGKPKKRKDAYSESHISNVRNGELPSREMATAFDMAFSDNGFLAAYEKISGSHGRAAGVKPHLPIDSGGQEAENQTEKNRRGATKLISETETLDGEWHAVYEVEPFSRSLAERVVVGSQQGDEALITDPNEGGRGWKLDFILWEEGRLHGAVRVEGLDTQLFVARRKTSSLIVGFLANHDDPNDQYLIVLGRDRDKAHKRFREEQGRRLACVDRTAIDLTTTDSGGDTAHEDSPSAHGGVTRHTGAGLAGTVHSFPTRDARQRRHR